MVDSEPSRDMDALFDFGAPVPPADSAADVAGGSAVLRGSAGGSADGSADGSAAAAGGGFGSAMVSRRELREAQLRRGRKTPAAPEPKAVARTARKAVAAKSPPARTAAVESTPAARKLRRSEVALVRASAPRRARKNPISVLVTMAAVGGMFAVVGLPAYALAPPASPAKDVTEASLQSVVVSSDATVTAPLRDGYRATTQAELAQRSRDALRAAQNAAYLASGARDLGDDYPWPYELRSFQGGGLSPLNYYYRECVDFVAWRLNRDAGSYAAPYKWVWSNLTPYGGDASQWRYNWEQHGWPISKVPVAGSVASFGGNHVAYVKKVNGDATVLVEEYNYIPGSYSQRTIPVSSVVAFLYPPPA